MIDCLVVKCEAMLLNNLVAIKYFIKRNIARENWK